MQRRTPKPPNEIEARPFRDYVAKPDKGAMEPIMAPGGWLVLFGLVVSVGAGVIYSRLGRATLAPIVEPSVDWLMSFVQ